jgi:hypothetical protein
MKTLIALFRTAPECRPNPRPSPSLRVPVTPANRGLLRWLRSAELAAWQEPGPKTNPVLRVCPRRFSEGPLFRVNINHTVENS